MPRLKHMAPARSSSDWCALWKLVKNGLMSEFSSQSGMSSVLSASDQARAVWA